MGSLLSCCCCCCMVNSSTGVRISRACSDAACACLAAVASQRSHDINMLCSACQIKSTEHNAVTACCRSLVSFAHRHPCSQGHANVVSLHHQSAVAATHIRSHDSRFTITVRSGIYACSVAVWGMYNLAPYHHGCR